MPQQANQPLPAGYVLNGFRIELAARTVADALRTARERA